MGRLTNRDLRGALSAVAACISAEPELFLARAAAEMQVLVPCDVVTVNLIDPARPSVEVTSDPPGLFDGSVTDAFAQVMGSHPVLDYHRRTGDLRALRISDFLANRAFRSGALYCDFYAPLGVAYQLATALPAAGSKLVGVTCNRASRDFSERDREVLDATRAALAATYAHIERARAARRTIGELVAALDGVPASGVVGQPSSALDRAMAGLTPRQRQVVSLVVLGATNREIAARLGISPRTVAKHVEHLHRRLGVSNRGSAVAALLRHGSLGPEPPPVPHRP